MPVVVPDSSEQYLLRVLLGIQAAPSQVVYHLFTNDYVPIESSTLSSFIELSGSLYAPLTIQTADWVVSTSGGITTAIRSMYAWPISGGATLYGYFVTDASGTVLLWCERFSSPIVVPAGGGTLNFTGKISLD